MKTRAEFEAELATWNGLDDQIGIIMPVSQLESYATVTLTTPVLCACERCIDYPDEKRHLIPVLIMLVAMDGLDSVRAQFPSAVVIFPGEPTLIRVPRPRRYLVPGTQCESEVETQ